VTRFLALMMFFVMAGGVALHQGVDFLEVGDWIGRLPGDLIIRKKGMIFYFPFTSALLASGALSLFFSLFSSRNK
jgi:hypothetical protein